MMRNARGAKEQRKRSIVIVQREGLKDKDRIWHRGKKRGGSANMSVVSTVSVGECGSGLIDD